MAVVFFPKNPYPNLNGVSLNPYRVLLSLKLKMASIFLHRTSSLTLISLIYVLQRYGNCMSQSPKNPLNVNLQFHKTMYIQLSF